MKIVNISPYLNVGFGYHDNIFPYYQKKNGHDVTIITSTIQDVVNDKNRILKAGYYEEKGIPVVRLKHLYTFTKRFLKLNGIIIELERIKPDLIFCHSLFPPNISEIISYCKKHKCKLVLDNHADTMNSAKSKLWKLLYYKIFLYFYYKLNDKYVEKYYGVTPARVDFLKNIIKVNSKKIELLPLGFEEEIYIDLIKNKEKFWSNNENITIKEDDIIITFGGKIDGNKKFENVIKAINNLNNLKIKLIIFGKISSDEIIKLIKENNNIYYVGWKSQLEKSQILINSDLAIWPKYHTTIIEDCIGAKLPMLLFKNGNTSHIIEKDDIYLKNDTVEEIEKNIRKILKDDNLQKAKIKMISKNKKFNYFFIAKKMIDNLR